MQETFSARELSRLTGLDRKTIATRFATLSEEPTVEEIVAAFVGLKAPEPPPSLYSTSQLAKLSGLNRATVADRLQGVPSQPGPKGATLYQLADALPALIAGRDVTLDEVKLKRETIKAHREEHAFNKELQKWIEVAEVSGELQKLWKALHNRLAIQLWRDHAASLHRAKSPGALAEMGQGESAKIFDALRTNYKTLF